MAYLLERDPLGKNSERIMLDVDGVMHQCALIKNLKVEAEPSTPESKERKNLTPIPDNKSMTGSMTLDRKQSYSLLKAIGYAKLAKSLNERKKIIDANFELMMQRCLAEHLVRNIGEPGNVEMLRRFMTALVVKKHNVLVPPCYFGEIHDE